MKKSNSLIHESSPYLLQHAHNPVDWYAWNETSLKKAKDENKPILLSIGYSSCHWCHVMEKESFENTDIATLMNENFVNIKVDREERPDLDQIYQNVAQLMTRSGGWPLTVFLTPDLKPFFGGTYFPPDDRYGRPGFARVLSALSSAFKEDQNSIQENAKKLTDAIEKMESIECPEKTRPDLEDFMESAQHMCNAIDWRNGGLQGAPKFLHTMVLNYLFRIGNLQNFGMARDAVLLSLSKMAQGGIFDQLRGGFHRYSVDDHWAVPHFEKMLYDNALLLQTYAEVLIHDKNLSEEEKFLFTRTLKMTTQYIESEMFDENLGAFYSAQDADSEGEEGKYFIWNKTEVLEVLKDETKTNQFCELFGITDLGNFHEHPGKTVLYQTQSLFQKEVDPLIKKLLHARDSREKPFCDEKILTSWNSLLITGLCWASHALHLFGEENLSVKARNMAERSYFFLAKNLCNRDSRFKILSVFKNNKAKLNGYLDDYAYFAQAGLSLLRFSNLNNRKDVLENTIAATECIEIFFKDNDSAGYFFTSSDHEKLIQRPKNIFDQAIPSGTAIHLQNLLNLSELTSNSKYLSKAQEAIDYLFIHFKNSPLGAAEIGNAALLSFLGPAVIKANEDLFHPFCLTTPTHNKEEFYQICHRMSCRSSGVQTLLEAVKQIKFN